MLPKSSMRLAVGRFGGQIAQGHQLGGAVAMLFGLVAIVGERFFVGLQDHQAVIAVDDHDVAAGDVGEERSGADDGGDFQTFGDDGGVAARPADFGDKAADELAVEIGRFAGREVVGQHDHGRDRRVESSSRRRPSRLRSRRFSMSKMSFARSAR